jgi:hypothetical protein
VFDIHTGSSATGDMVSPHGRAVRPRPATVSSVEILDFFPEGLSERAQVDYAFHAENPSSPATFPRAATSHGPGSNVGKSMTIEPFEAAFGSRCAADGAVDAEALRRGPR